MTGDHNHVPRDFGPAFALGIALNAVYVVVEAGYGFVSGSLALVAHAAHNLSDVDGLVLAWGAVALSRRKPSDRHTYGLGRTSILAALVNGVALMIAVGALVWEAIGRFSAPAEVDGGTVLWVALIGIAINAGTAKRGAPVDRQQLAWGLAAVEPTPTAAGLDFIARHQSLIVIPLCWKYR